MLGSDLRAHLDRAVWRCNLYTTRNTDRCPRTPLGSLCLRSTPTPTPCLPVLRRPYYRANVQPWVARVHRIRGRDSIGDPYPQIPPFTILNDWLNDHCVMDEDQSGCTCRGAHEPPKG